jgi:hypothetical protein
MAGMCHWAAQQTARGRVASNYQTSPHPQRHSDEAADRRRLEKLSIVRTLPHVPDRNPIDCAGRPHSDLRARYPGFDDEAAPQNCGCVAFRACNVSRDGRGRRASRVNCPYDPVGQGDWPNTFLLLCFLLCFRHSAPGIRKRSGLESGTGDSKSAARFPCASEGARSKPAEDVPCAERPKACFYGRIDG